MITEFRNLGKSIIRLSVRGENQMTDLENKIHKTMEKCNKKSCIKYFIINYIHVQNYRKHSCNREDRLSVVAALAKRDTSDIDNR